MNKKGFTLIELIAVIVILSLIAVLVFPAVVSVIRNSKEKAYQDQVAIIEKAAEQCVYEHSSLLPDEVNDASISLPLSCLMTGCTYKGVEISGGYISDEELLNPRNSKPMEGSINVTYKVAQKQYVFEFVAAD